MGPLLLLFVFIAAPILEIAVILKVGSLVGLWPTLALIVGTAVVGTIVLRLQGLATIAEARRQMADGQPPVDPVLHGVLLLVAGAFLLTPGFVTDTLGFCLLVPPVRTRLGRALFSAVRVRAFGARGGPRGGPRPGGKADAQRPGQGPGQVIDADYEERPKSGGTRSPDGSPWQKRDNDEAS
jgi:UPF0716 protein FxsA